MKLNPNARGTVYLVHFSGRTRQNRQHYLGWSADVGRRFTEHASGRGAHATRKARAEGLKVKLAQAWSGTPDLERRIKEWSRDGAHGFAGLCPYCDRGTKLPEALARELGPADVHRPMGRGVGRRGDRRRERQADRLHRRRVGSRS
jgi:predicted GIY-YIG superfamily endonuclease